MISAFTLYSFSGTGLPPSSIISSVTEPIELAVTVGRTIAVLAVMISSPAAAPYAFIWSTASWKSILFMETATVTIFGSGTTGSRHRVTNSTST